MQQLVIVGPRRSSPEYGVTALKGHARYAIHGEENRTQGRPAFRHLHLHLLVYPHPPDTQKRYIQMRANHYLMIAHLPQWVIRKALTESGIDSGPDKRWKSALLNFSAQSWKPR